jgi:hypothetical protein
MLSNLKTYITKIENIEKTRVNQYLDYLNNEEHSNHIGRTEIVGQMNDRQSFFDNNQKKIDRNVEKTKRGVKLKYSNKSLTFNLPKDYETTEKDLKTIQNNLVDTLIGIYKENGVEVSKIDFYSNIHNQQNKHINFIIPYLDVNGKTIRFIKSKDNFYKRISNEFTKIVDNVLNTDIKQYITVEQKFDKVKSDNEVLEQFEELLEMDFDLEFVINEIEQLIQHTDSKPIKNFLRYNLRLQNGILENNKKKIEDNERRIEKVYEKSLKNAWDYKLSKIVKRYSDLKNSNSMNKNHNKGTKSTM